MLNASKVKLANFLSLSPDYTELAKGMSKGIFLVDTPSSFKTYKEYMTQVKSNQVFLESI